MTERKDVPSKQRLSWRHFCRGNPRGTQKTLLLSIKSTASGIDIQFFIAAKPYEASAKYSGDEGQRTPVRINDTDIIYRYSLIFSKRREGIRQTDLYSAVESLMSLTQLYVVTVTRTRFSPDRCRS